MTRLCGIVGITVPIFTVLVAFGALAGSVTYAYDELGRLTKATYANEDSIAYTYDPAGNRISVQSDFFDHDGDGMPDAWEIINGLNPDVDDAALDPDADGLTNLQEFLAGADPNLADTDGDGKLDGADPNPIFDEAKIGGIITSILD